MVKSSMKHPLRNSAGTTRKKVSWGPFVKLTKIPYYADEDVDRLFYTDEEYDRFEAAEQRRIATIRLLYDEHKSQHRFLTLQLLHNAENVVLQQGQDDNSNNRKRKADHLKQEQLLKERKSMTTSATQDSIASNRSQEEEEDDASSHESAGSGRSCLNRLAKRQRVSIMKVSAYAA